MQFRKKKKNVILNHRQNEYPARSVRTTSLQVGGLQRTIQKVNNLPTICLGRLVDVDDFFFFVGVRHKIVKKMYLSISCKISSNLGWNTFRSGDRGSLIVAWIKPISRRRGQSNIAQRAKRLNSPLLVWQNEHIYLCIYVFMYFYLTKHIFMGIQNRMSYCIQVRGWLVTP